MSVKSINILGVTGSVGNAAVDVILSAPEKFDVQAVTAHRNAGKLAELAVKLKAKKAVIADEKNFSELRERLQRTDIEAVAGLEEAQVPADLTIAAIVGMAGLRPVMAAVKNSKCIAIANKEPLVAAGPLIMAEAKRHGTVILPVDSEHNAVFQVFESENRNAIQKIILTASGGPFRSWTSEEMESATPAQALAHPNWSMGPKISVDSATMMNKALEVIEAHYLFNMPPEKIEVLVHPQSVVHSMVEYRDGSVLAQMAASDMRTPLSHVMAWPQRMETPGQRLDLAKMKRLDFDLPDLQRFPLLKMAWRALEYGPSACITLNAANELAVEAFLQGKTGFHGIINLIYFIMDKVERVTLSSLEDIEDLDRIVRKDAQSYIDQGRL